MKQLNNLKKLIHALVPILIISLIMGPVVSLSENSTGCLSPGSAMAAKPVFQPDRISFGNDVQEAWLDLWEAPYEWAHTFGHLAAGVLTGHIPASINSKSIQFYHPSGAISSLFIAAAGWMGEVSLAAFSVDLVLLGVNENAPFILMTGSIGLLSGLIHFYRKFRFTTKSTDKETLNEALKSIFTGTIFEPKTQFNHDERQRRREHEAKQWKGVGGSEEQKLVSEIRGGVERSIDNFIEQYCKIQIEINKKTYHYDRLDSYSEKRVELANELEELYHRRYDLKLNRLITPEEIFLYLEKNQKKSEVFTTFEALMVLYIEMIVRLKHLGEEWSLKDETRFKSPVRGELMYASKELSRSRIYSTLFGYQSLDGIEGLFAEDPQNWPLMGENDKKRRLATRKLFTVLLIYLLDVEGIQGLDVSSFKNSNPSRHYNIEYQSVSVYLARANLNGTNLTGVDLRGANLRKAFLRWTVLNRANLEGARMNGADLSCSDLIDTKLNSTILTDAILKDVIITPDLKSLFLKEGSINDYQLELLIVYENQSIEISI